MRRHHANGETLDEMIAVVSQLPANEKQTLLEAAGAEAVQARAIELQQMDPAVLDPAIAGVLLGQHEPDDLPAQVRCPIHLLAAQAEFGGATDVHNRQRFLANAPACSNARLEGTGHGIHEARPAEYVEALQQFMASVSTHEARK